MILFGFENKKGAFETLKHDINPLDSVLEEAIVEVYEQFDCFYL